MIRYKSLKNEAIKLANFLDKNTKKLQKFTTQLKNFSFLNKLKIEAKSTQVTKLADLNLWKNKSKDLVASVHVDEIKEKLQSYLKIIIGEDSKLDFTSYKYKLFLQIVYLLEAKVPFANIPFIGKKIGNFVYRFNRKRRNIAFKQLKIAFPNWSSSQIQKVALASFQNLGITIVEIMKKKEYADDIDYWIQNKNLDVIAELKKNWWYHSYRTFF